MYEKIMNKIKTHVKNYKKMFWKITKKNCCEEN